MGITVGATNQQSMLIGLLTKEISEQLMRWMDEASLSLVFILVVNPKREQLYYSYC